MKKTIRTNVTDVRDSVGLWAGMSGLTGVGAGKLFTPQSGKNTRTQGKHKSKDDNESKTHVPGEPQEAADKIENKPNRDSSTPKIKDQKLSEELLANDSLGG